MSDFSDLVVDSRIFPTMLFSIEVALMESADVKPSVSHPDRDVRHVGRAIRRAPVVPGVLKAMWLMNPCEKCNAATRNEQNEFAEFLCDDCLQSKADAALHVSDYRCATALANLRAIGACNRQARKLNDDEFDDNQFSNENGNGEIY
jgi:hypothetical protein